jgi:hypothetical protein
VESYELKKRLPAFGFRLPAFRFRLSLRAFQVLFFRFAYFGSREDFVSREAAKECSPRRKPWVTRRKFGKAPKGAEEDPLHRHFANV